MIDLTNAQELIPRYADSEPKRTLLYNGKVYMVKFPEPVRGKKHDLSYIYNQFSEDMGCKILQSAGLNVQNTFLATYQEKNGEVKIVVACEDFCPPDARLTEFKKLMLAVTDREEKRTNSIEMVNEVLEKSNFTGNKTAFKQRFWDMFVGDALLGNSDRHLNNFGVIEHNGTISFAPIYDCGSSLSPLLSDAEMERLLGKDGELSNKEYNIPSFFSYQGRRIFYHEIFKNPPPELAAAIRRVVPHIDMGKAEQVIQATEGISAIRKHYLSRGIALRYDKILFTAWKKLA